MTSLTKILLIDDEEATNFYHKHIISEIGVAEKIECFENGTDAINYLLKNNEDNDRTLIFLDLNMPGISGWEFMEIFGNLKSITDFRNTKLYILTTSVHDDDEFKALEDMSINGFINKPLTQASVEDIIEKHFKADQV
ncbi:response regulator [Persicobacter psychrovividus]|uniref:Response regulator n=1 Tax=Persicobacter psychrovividus TaxID=387638 RepID=A0ABN6LF09_9BACT|nr:response regulator [Persicobacter psychrovividus]